MTTTTELRSFWGTSIKDRVATLRKRVAFSEAFIANKSNPIEHRIAERRALASWRKSLLVLEGFAR